MGYRYLTQVLGLVLVALAVGGCRMPADPAVGFVDPKLMQPSPEETAFRREYTAQNYEPQRYRKIYVMPVVFTDSIPNGTLEAANIRNWCGWRDEDLKELVDYAYVSLRNAFGRDGRFTLADQPGGDAVKVEMALVRVVPGKPVFNGCTLVLLPFPIGPALHAGLNAMTDGSFNSVCSMECRITDGRSGRLIMGLADNEKSKSAILNLLNFTAYGNQRQIIDELADNIVRKMAASAGDKIPEPANFVIINY